MLHIVSKSLLFERCLQYCSYSDADAHADEIILIDDGVCAITNESPLPTLCKQKGEIIIYAVEEHIQKRKLITRIPEHVNLINYEQFVKLVVKHPQTLTWF